MSISKIALHHTKPMSARQLHTMELPYTKSSLQTARLLDSSRPESGDQTGTGGMVLRWEAITMAVVVTHWCRIKCRIDCLKTLGYGLK